MSRLLIALPLLVTLACATRGSQAGFSQGAGVDAQVIGTEKAEHLSQLIAESSKSTPEALPAPPASLESTVPAFPSGMELLYSDRVPILPSGEPMIAVGITTGQKTLTFHGRGTTAVDFYEGDVFKRATVASGTDITVEVTKAKGATRSFNVDLEGVAYGNKRGLDQAVVKWTQRNVGDIRVIEEGSAIGLSGSLIDNREWRLWVTAKSKEDAAKRVQAINQRYGDRVTVAARLMERPWAELSVRAGGLKLGTAVSYVRLITTDDTAVEVANVEFAKGYAWEGHEDRAYTGEVYAVVDPDGTLAAVNVNGAEKVLEGVVPSEMFASAPAEALKTQAVAARNQLFAKLGRRHHDDPFHLCSEQHCQVYSGVNRRDPRATAAVEATSGEVLFRDGRLVDTVYSSTCGGHTEDNDVVWGNSPDPALRGRPDFDTSVETPLTRFARGIKEGDLFLWLGVKDTTYCAKATQAKADRFRWERSFDTRQLLKIVATNYPHIGAPKELIIDGRGPGGRVTSLTIVGDSGRERLTFEYPIRKMFENLSSGAFDLNVVHDDDGHIARATFRGAGWGHGVGMCQMGSMGRAEAGQSYKRILSHYYNGAEALHVYGVNVANK
ncbi:MAG: SpoIID/LytB domain-containing protein [Clostridia bacterium]|nr:SpoIID/LytB domain-containing protein [Deltaproteobacteria bacterium]